jgi:hypothetical protein
MSKAITMIEAQEMLVALKKSDWPNMKQHDRDKLHKSLFDQAYFKNNSQDMTMRNAFEYLRSVKNGK